eukprot:gene13771-18209_t
MSAQIVQGVGASWKNLGYVYLTLEASINDFQCSDAAANGYLNKAPCKWVQSRSDNRQANFLGWLNMLEPLGAKGGSPYDQSGVVDSDWKQELGISPQGFAAEWEVPKSREDLFGQERHIVMIDNTAKEMFVQLADTHKLTNPEVSLRLKVQGVDKELTGTTCLQDHNGDGDCTEELDVLVVYSGIFKLGLLATCGDINGKDEGTVPVTSAHCGTNFVPKEAAAAERCDSNVCLFSAKPSDKATCCIEQATCGDKDGVGYQRLSIADADCGSGYERRSFTVDGDDDIDGERCEGAICNPLESAHDRDTCCIPLARCGDTNGVEEGDPDVTQNDCGVGRIPNPAAVADPAAFTQTFEFRPAIKDRDTCCLSLATCSDKNGPKAEGVDAITDAECGEGFVAKPGVGLQYCAGPDCDPSGVDQATCCVPQATCGDRTNAALIQSCEERGWPLHPKNDPDAKSCGQSDGGFDCTAAVDHATAAAVCKATGARLCHVHEFYDNVVQGSGCGFDESLVWSDEPCTDGNAAGWWAVRGKESYDVPDACLTSSSGHVSNVRCCSDPDTDAAATAHVHPVMDFDCGFGYLAKEGVAGVLCNGLVCDASGADR